MTRQRKTHLLLLALVPVLVLGAIRCADSTTAPSAPTMSQAGLEPPVAARLAGLHAKYDWIGQFHNDALKFVLENLQRIPEKSRSRRTICETARKAYNEFHRSRRQTETPANIDADFRSFCAASGFNASVASTTIGLPDLPRATELSSTAQAYLDQIGGAVDAASSNPDLTARINSIEASAAANLSEDEAGAVVIVGSVTESSAQYWEANLSAWLPFTSTGPDYSRISSSETGSGALSLSPSGSTPRFDFWSDLLAIGKRAVRGDVRGAITMVLRVGILGLPFIYEEILAGAAVGSITSVLQI